MKKLYVYIASLAAVLTVLILRLLALFVFKSNEKFDRITKCAASITNLCIGLHSCYGLYQLIVHHRNIEAE